MASSAQRIGRLRFRLDLLKKNMTSQGNLAERFNAEWNTVVQRDGDIQPTRGARYWQNRNVEDNITHLITVRYEESLEDRGRISYIRHTHTKPFGQFYFIEDADIDDTLDIFTLAGLNAATGEQYNVQFFYMTNMTGNYFIRDLGSDQYSIHPTAQDAIDDTNRVDLVKDGTEPARIKVKAVLEQRGILYEVMNVKTVDQRKRYIQYECIELGNQDTYNVV